MSTGSLVGYAQCYWNRTDHRTGEAQNVNRTGTGKKPGKKPAD